MKNIKLTIGIPNANSYFHQRFMTSLLFLKYPPNIDVSFNFCIGYQIPFARNKLIEDAFKDKSDYMLFLDADMIFPPELLERLLSHDKNIINALAFRRTNPFTPCIFSWHNEHKFYQLIDYSKQDNVFKVDATGMSTMLIKMDVFRKIQKPWYYYKDNRFSSDLSFCMKVKENNYDIWIDQTLDIGHIGHETIIDKQYYANTKKTSN